jgi:hypothetical protein
VAAIEVVNHLMTKASEGPLVTVFGIGMNTGDWHSWLLPPAGLVFGGLALSRLSGPLATAWDRAQRRAIPTGQTS